MYPIDAVIPIFIVNQKHLYYTKIIKFYFCGSYVAKVKYTTLHKYQLKNKKVDYQGIYETSIIDFLKLFYNNLC